MHNYMYRIENGLVQFLTHQKLGRQNCQRVSEHFPICIGQRILGRVALLASDELTSSDGFNRFTTEIRMIELEPTHIISFLFTPEVGMAQPTCEFQGPSVVRS